MKVSIICLLLVTLTGTMILHPVFYSSLSHAEATQNTSSMVLDNNHKTEELEKKYAIGFVAPIFTAAAYNNAFYVFYEKYAKAKSRVNITNNLHLLSSDVTAAKNHANMANVASAESIAYFAKHTALLLPESNITVLTDLDLHQGSIFKKTTQDNESNSNDNIYDVLVLGHQEYVTQDEYDNLKKYVSNGGILLLLDSNVFYAEVGYDPIDHKVTLIKGHGWAFNGKTAWNSVGERWKEESAEWVGSNYLCYSCTITFVNNPFGYIHKEDNHITNPDANILIDYNASVLTNSPKDRNATHTHSYKIGLYELSYKKGKVISFSVYTDDANNSRSLVLYFDKLLLENLKGIRRG